MLQYRIEVPINMQKRTSPVFGYAKSFQKKWTILTRPLWWNVWLHSWDSLHIFTVQFEILISYIEKIKNYARPKHHCFSMYDYISGTTNRYLLYSIYSSKSLLHKEFKKILHVLKRKRNTFLLCNITHTGPKTSYLRKTPLGLSFKYTFYKQGGESTVETTTDCWVYLVYLKAANTHTPRVPPISHC